MLSPPPSNGCFLQKNLGTLVPQSRYASKTPRGDWTPRTPIPFSTQGCPGVSLLDSVNGKFEGIDGAHEYPFNGMKRRTIIIRIHVGSLATWQSAKTNKILLVPWVSLQRRGRENRSEEEGERIDAGKKAGLRVE